MMRLARRATLLVALFLLTSAATAYAECAWVLWENVETVVSVGGDGPFSFKSSTAADFWRPVDTHLSRKDCLDAFERRYRIWPTRPLKVGDGRDVYNCLPDTVDPRGAKGK